MPRVNLNRINRVFAGLVLAGMLPAASLLAVEAKTISAVDVQQEEGGVTRIVLSGAEDPIYTAFKREDPSRLIVEMPDVVFNGVPTPVRVDNGVVNSVMLGAFGDPRVALSMARVSVGLEGDVDYELLPDGDQLVIEIRPKFDVMAKLATSDVVDEPAAADAPGTEMASSESAPAAMAPEAEDDVSELEDASGPMTAPTLAPAAEEPAADASAVSRIQKVVANGDMIEIAADGPIDNIDSFDLDDPERLVIDFWGARNGVSPRQFPVSGSSVERVRIGEHPDKVRVVFDLGVELESHRVEPVAEGVKVRLVASAAGAAGTPADMPVPAAPADEPVDEPTAEMDEAASEPMDEAQAEPMSEPADEASTPDVAPEDEVADAVMADPTVVYADSAEVESVHFESLPAVDRVVVTMTQPVEPKLFEADPTTLMVLLPGASMETEAERRVETKDFHGPLQMFSVFNTPDIDTAEVRVVLKRQAGVAANLQWREGQLHIELPRSGGAASGPAVTGAVPAPEMQDSESWVAPDSDMEAAAAMPEVPAAPAPQGSAPKASGSPFEDDEFFGGPADPASIDILEEGGFADDKEYGGRRVSLDFKDADIANILRLIAEVSDLNVIAGEEVVGRVTIRLVDVPWDQALDVILLTKGLGFVRVGNVLRIAPLETLKLEAEQRLQERRAKEKLEDLVVKLQPVNFADVKEVQQLVKRLLSGRGSANVDKRTNTLIIKDIPSVVHEATALVKAIDTQTPQVMIEAKIVEATLGFSRSLGAVWGVGYRPGSGGGGEDFHLGDGTLPAANGGGLNNTNFLASNPVLGAINGLLNLGVLALDDQLQLDLQIQAAESTNKGKVISSPRVVTLDNREAVIKQGVAIKFESATRDRITISFVDAVLELKVTPHITANRSIIMEIKVSRNAPELSEASGDIVGIAKNETETEALVKDGETIVLGGIYVVESGGGHSKTPFLSDIPVLGVAFKNMTHQDERRELLVFVTPRVILGSPTEDL